MKKIVTLSLLAAILAAPVEFARAAQGSDAESPSIIERIDRLGEKVFSGVLPGKRRTTHATQEESSSSDRAGSAFASGNRTSETTAIRPRPDPLLQGGAGSAQTVPSVPQPNREPTLPSPGSQVSPTQAPAIGGPAPSQTVPTPAGGQGSLTAEGASAADSGSALYQKMLEYRTSPFASQTASPTRPRGVSEPGTEVQVVDSPLASSAPVAGTATSSVPSRDFANSPRVPTVANPQIRSEPTPASGASTAPKPPTTTSATSPSLGTGETRSPTPAVWQPSTAAVPQVARAGSVPSSVPAATAQVPTPAVPAPGSTATTGRSEAGPVPGEEPSKPGVTPPRQAVGSFPGNGTAGERTASLGLSGSGKAIGSPVLLVETNGPREITLGKPGLYEVFVRNIGRGTGNQVRVTVALPLWAEVVEQVPTTGAVEITANAGNQDLVWMIQQIDPQKEERLRLKLIPRESKPIELAVQYTVLAPVNETKIEVREPKLAIRVDGPEQALFGRAELYRLEVVNTGTGEADNVVLSLLPVGTGQKTPARQTLGSIPPGEKRVVEVELVPRQTGAIQIEIEVTADGGIRAQLEHVVTVIRPALEVSVTGPAMQFVNQDDRYQIAVRNPGTAPAENVRVQVMCPESVEPDLTAMKGVKPVGDVLEWSISSLPAGHEVVIEVPCHFVGMGDARLMVQATAEGNLSTQGECLTQIQAVADLVLRVEDPPRPVPVGKDGLYQIIVENRGSKAAVDVRVVGFFSEGIEPLSAKGIPHKVLPGQVVFEPISKIEPGERVVLEIQARAHKPGNHIFRAELRCPSSDIRLAAEETTRYYDALIAERPGDSSSKLR